MMASAFAGHDFLKEAYDIAVKEKYNFYSYGDAMLIIQFKMKKDVRSLTHDELISFFEINNYSSYRATQVHDWLWKKSCFSFDEMTNLSKDMREFL